MRFCFARTTFFEFAGCNYFLLSIAIGVSSVNPEVSCQDIIRVSAKSLPAMEFKAVPNPCFTSEDS